MPRWYKRKLKTIVDPYSDAQLYKKGKLVQPRIEAVEQGLIQAGRVGIITKFFSNCRMAYVKWDGAKKSSQWHIDLLSPLSTPPNSIVLW